jgi:hypothetical protein
MNLIERLELWDKLINMESKYNNMYLENILTSFSDFDNAYKVFMSLSLSGSKLITRVCGGWGIHPGVIYPLNSRYTVPGCGGRGVHTPVDRFRPQRYGERKAYKCC